MNAKAFLKAGLALSILACAGSALATPVTYDFTATNFSSYSGNPVPNDPVSGSVTLDGTTVTGLNLTIGSHTYTAAEVAYDPSFPILGGTASGVNGITWGTDDFWLFGGLSSFPFFFNFKYSVSGINDIFSSDTGTLTVAPDVSPVPLPASGLLMAFGLAGIGFAGRRKR